MSEARRAAVEAEHEAAEVCTKVRTTTCPWSGLFDEDVRLVRWCNTFWHKLDEAWGDDPEMWLVEATAFYHHALDAAVAKVYEKPVERVEVGEKGGRIRG